MTDTLKLLYKKLVLDKPVITLFITLLIIAFLSFFIKDFKLDASADSLVLENDEDLRYYRGTRAIYGSDEYLFITYAPYSDLFSQKILDNLNALQTDLENIERVEFVTSLLNVPLINSPKVTISQLTKHTPTLKSPQTDIALAKKEFLESPLYSNLIISEDGKTTALQVFFKQDETYATLLKKRNALRLKDLENKLTKLEQQNLEQVSRDFKRYSASLADQQQADIASVRNILDKYRNHAEIHLGGPPMIVSDMVDYIERDINVFGFAVLIFLVVLLTLFFRKPRWVILPLTICLAASLGMIGFLGLMEWRVTVVSSNFISLMLILTLSLAVHLIVRYRELHSSAPLSTQKTLVWETVRSKAEPAFYTAITTMVAFGSLLVSGIRPVIDFGWMMVFAVTLAFILAFVMFPTGLLFLQPGQAKAQHDFTGAITRFFAHLIERHGNTVFATYIIIIVLSIVGITSLTVENRFIDYFKQSTEIYQGMVTIDRDLGGTTPLEVILEPDKEYFNELEELITEGIIDLESAGISGTSYWFNIFQLDEVEKIHNYLEGLPETGKVLSLATSTKLMTQLNDGKPLDNVSLSVIYKRLPESIKESLFKPYMTDDGNQVRFTIRVFESDVTLKRQELLNKIRKELEQKFDLAPEQIHLTGMVVLYNNMLQSLFKSQILTLGVVFLAILVMFMVLFRSIKIAMIAIIPNIFAAVFVLGLIGWLNIPLDIMTITIAAITIGIAVDDTIHYVHRFMEEFPKDRDYWATVKRCHSSIGKAMYYTSITITLGFSILVLSNFIPTINFGLLTGVAMVAALIADLTLLPLLLVKFKPLK